MTVTCQSALWPSELYSLFQFGCTALSYDRKEGCTTMELTLLDAGATPIHK
jgi:hypothetical protein